MGDNDPIEGEVVPESAPTPPSGEANWLALVSNYTERPDLFLAEVEKHDPGFTARMNKDAQERAQRTESARFAFSKFQAYSAVLVSIGAAGALLYILFKVIESNKAGFWTILGLAIFYAITQGGLTGFERIAHAVARIFDKTPKE